MSIFQSFIKACLLLSISFDGISVLCAQTQSAAPRKSNARPAATTTQTAKPKGEPFDDASVAAMAEKCVVMTTEKGAIEVELMPEAAPLAVRNFLNLTATKAFDGTTFSRVVKDFVVQGGDLSTRPTPLTAALATRAARRLPDEPNYIKHARGVISMARGDEPNTATTSFFIVMNDSPHLDNKFAAFGRVRRGMETVDLINQSPLDGEKPRQPVRITQAVVTTCEAGKPETPQ